jgi:hypothetical protein
MENKEDTIRNIGTFLFLILFVLFAFTFSGKSKSQTPISLPVSLQHELTFGYNSDRSDAAVFNADPFPVYNKTIICPLNRTNLNPFDFKFEISGYNRKTAQDYLLLQKNRLSIEYVLLWKFCSPLLFSENEDIPPVLG